ncbi:MAG: hypothetical protein EA366_03955 [Spirulina sp. DLM2.Bin59]|nr:MAG: hypothetical protein EA366_03955 [Spirulina sp. DLM2.Bin59]
MGVMGRMKDEGGRMKGEGGRGIFLPASYFLLALGRGMGGDRLAFLIMIMIWSRRMIIFRARRS